jgi:hypothetical protein
MMLSTFEAFKKQLDDAIDIIDEAALVEKKVINLPLGNSHLVDTESLLARCESVCQKYKSNKPVIRIIHHFACSGGTMISKCLAAMPNTYLLSEVHPSTELHLGSGKPKYSPTDISSLIKYADIPNADELAAELFLSNIINAYEHVCLYGGTLVLRDHSHADFCLGETSKDRGAVYSLLEKHFQIQNIVTIRNPIDAYLSLVKNNWLHFTPASFEEYCRRFIAMTKEYAGCDFYLYEDLVKAPVPTMEKICQSLNLDFSNYFEYIFELFRVTGDSGRTSPIIAERSRADLSLEFLTEIKCSESFKEICKCYGYSNLV